MSSTSKAWTVEAMKDQGICRWGNALRSLQQHAKNSVGSYSQAKKLSTPSSSAISKKYKCDNTIESEESLRKVMTNASAVEDKSKIDTSAVKGKTTISKAEHEVLLLLQLSMDQCILIIQCGLYPPQLGWPCLFNCCIKFNFTYSNSKSGRNMSSTSRDWTVAASFGAVEAMKNQGICRVEQYTKVTVTTSQGEFQIIFSGQEALCSIFFCYL
nr:hypothetical protein CFP56_59917 [Quercus suber]